MKVLHSLRGQLALIILIAIMIPVSVIGYYSLAYESEAKNLAQDAATRLDSAASELEPLFAELGQGAKEEDLAKLNSAVMGVMRTYPSIKVSYFNGSAVYTLLGAGHGREGKDTLLVSIPTGERASELKSVIAAGAGISGSLKEGYERGPQSMEAMLPVGRDKQGLLILETMLGQFFLESNQSRQAVEGSLILGLLTGILGILWISHRFQQRIVKIQSGLGSVTKDLNIPLDPQSGELGLIVDSINQMREELLSKRNLEEQLQRAERLAGLGQLVAGVAHEVRSPLGIIKGTVQLLERDMESEPRLQQYRGHLEIIREQVQRQNRVVEELLTYARPVKPQFGPVSIPGILDSVFGFLEPTLRQQGIWITKVFEDSTVTVWGDGERLKQVFVNLLLNCKEALPQGGNISIRMSKQEEWLKVQVSDGGPGIQPHDLGHIFEPFFSTKEAGTGLGLSIAKQLIDLHNGTITVDSKPGCGSTFTVRIPLGGEPDAHNSGDR